MIPNPTNEEVEAIIGRKTLDDPRVKEAYEVIEKAVKAYQLVVMKVHKENQEKGK